MEIVTSWMKEGIEQGIQQGKEEEAASLVIRQIERRFGSLNVSEKKSIRSLSLEGLEDLGEALLDFKNTDDLTDWLRDHQ